MRFAATFVAACLAATSAHAWNWGGGVEGNGKKTTQTREVPGTFDAIATRGSIDARVKVGPAPSISVTIDENLQQYVKVRLEGTRLVIEQGHDTNLSYHGDGYVTVTVPTLRAASTGGSGDITIDGSSGGDLELTTSGSGDLHWRGEAKKLEVSTSGSGNAHLSGKAASLDASTSGSGDLKGEDLTIGGDAKISTSGSGDVEIRMSGGALRARTSGSGDVVYRGDAKTVDAVTSGSGEIVRK
jgi:hypothetical protein